MENKFLEIRSTDSIARKVLVTVLIGISLKFVTLLYDYYFGVFYITQSSGNQNSIIEIILDLCLFTVLIEELGFRYFLFQSEFKKYLVSISFVSSIIVVKFMGGFYNGDHDLLINDLIKISLGLTIYALLSLIIIRRGEKRISFKKSISQIFISSLIFGILHLNFENTNLIQDILYVIPIFVLGILLSVVRIKLGFGYSILLHSTYNAIASISLLWLIQ